jgi:hypothetical protein
MMMRGSDRRAIRHVVLAAWALASCADPRGPDEPVDARDAVEDSAEAAVDAVTDVTVDAVTDVTVDAVTDVTVDAAPDVTVDTMTDVTVDAMTDVTVDAAIDAPRDARDAAPDVAIDAPLDAAPDVAVDVRDAAADAPVDVAPDVRDAAPDVVVDAGPPLGGCVSGAAGTHVARFRWTGSGSRSRATVSYEANTLPDRARWRVTANSRSIGYTPVFDDVFLGVGGLDLSGTVFIDVELSTAGLARLSNVTVAVFGRSFNTTASGSYAWQTFDGTGAAPSGLVANSAPYQWYRADATRAFAPGNSGVLLRIMPGPPSGSLIVSRVEICFDAR